MRAPLLPTVTLAALALAGTLCAQAPVFRGVLGMGKRQVALFEIPGQSGNWQGEAGMTVPGTSWKLTRVMLNPGQALITVPGRAPVTLSSGDTYTGGARAEKAPDVARPQNEAAAEYVAPTPEQESAGRRRAAEAAARLRASLAQRPAATTGGTHFETDVSRTVPRLESFGDKSYDTAVMVVSAACPRCAELKPEVMKLPSRRPHTRVVFAEIGKDDRGGINWGAPFMREHRIARTPYFLLLDPAGRVVREGDAAEQQVFRWLATEPSPPPAGSETSK